MFQKSFCKSFYFSCTVFRSPSSSAVKDTLSKEFTIGADMNYGDRITVSWGATGDDGQEYSGTATYTKVDPNASITIHVSAAEAPNLYVWGTDAQGKNSEPAGKWPGKLLTETKEVNGTTSLTFSAFVPPSYL